MSSLAFLSREGSARLASPKSRKANRKRVRRIEAAIESLESRCLLSALLPSQPVAFQTVSEIPLATNERPYGPVDLIDLNNDGNPDIVYLGGASVNVMLGNGDGTFKAPVNYAVTGGTGSHTEYYAMAVANLAGDGEAPVEAVVVLEGPRKAGSPATINILLANSNGTLATAKTYSTPTTGTAPNTTPNGPEFINGYGIAIGQLEGPDTPPDIVVTDSYNRTVTIMVGNGNGTFSTNYEVLKVGDQPEGVAIADVDGRVYPNSDGVPINDILVGNNGDGTMSILLNNADAVTRGTTVETASTFKTQTVIPLVGDSHFAIANISGDFSHTTIPIPDLVTTGAGANGTFAAGSILLDKPTANNPFNFTKVNNDPSYSYRGSAISLHGDGFDELTVNYDTGTVGVALGQSNGNFSATQTYSTVANYIAFNTSGNTATISANEILGYGPVGVTAGYIVRNTDESTYSPDLVIVDHGIDNFGVGSSAAAYTPAITIVTSSGNAKFVGEKSSQVSFGVDPNGYPNNGPTTDNYPNTLLVANVAGDGDPAQTAIIEVSYGSKPKATVVANEPTTYTASNYPGSIEVFLDTGQGHFTPEPLIPDIYGPCAVAVADVDGDGIPDLVVAQRYNSSVAIFKGMGNGMFAGAPELVTRVSPNQQQTLDVAVGALGGISDTNGDGYTINDIIVSDYGAKYSSKTKPGYPGDVVVLLNNGFGDFSFGQNIPDSYGPSGIVFFNNDGSYSIAVTNRTNIIEGQAGNGSGLAGNKGTGNAIQYFVGNDDGTFRTYDSYFNPFTLPVGDGPTAIVTGYLDGSSNPADLVVLNETGDSISVLRQNSDGTFAPQRVYDVQPGNIPKNPNASSPIGLAVADVNGDGLADVVFTYGGTNTKPGAKVGILLNIGGTYLNDTPIPVQTSGLELLGSTTNPKPVTAIPVAVAVADVNGDSRADIITQDSTGLKYDGEISVLLQGQPLTGPTFASADHATFTSGISNTFSISTNGAPAATISEGGILPSGVKFTAKGNGTATLSGVPSATSGGVYHFTLSATNGYAPNATESFTLTVDQSPTISSAATTVFTAGTAGTFSITTTGFPNPTLHESGVLPSGVTFVSNGNGTATLAGTAAEGTGGLFDLTITAGNGFLPNASQTFTLVIDQAPLITSGTAATFTTNTAASPFTITTAAGTYPTAVLSEMGALPSGVTFVDNGNGTATLGGTPATGTGGIYDFTINATNGANPAGSEGFTLTVDQPASVTSAARTVFTTGDDGAFTVSTSGFPVAALSEVGALPGGVTFTDNGNGTATLTGTPSVGSGGKYALTIDASNGIGSVSSQPFMLVVKQPLAPAFTSANAATFLTGVGDEFTVTTTGFPAPSISESGTLPSGVTFTDNGDGTATISGAASATAGGKYRLVLTAANGNQPNAVEVFKLFVDEPPTITSDNQTTFGVGSFGSFSITTDAYPVDKISEIGALPPGVTLVDNGNGTATLSGTPLAATAGEYAITIKAKNGVQPRAMQSFTLFVSGPPAITSSAQTTFTTSSSGSFNITTAGFPTPVITEQGTLPSGVAFQANGDGTATLSGTPAPLTGGVYPLTFGAINGIAPMANQNFTLIIDQAPVFTSAPEANFLVGTSGSFTVEAAGYPAPHLILMGTLPAGLSFTDNGNGSGTITGSPGAAGTYNLTFKARNGVQPKAMQPFSIIVTAPVAGAAVRPLLLSSSSADTLASNNADAALLDAQSTLLGGGG
jgi:hypothetical protein